MTTPQPPRAQAGPAAPKESFTIREARETDTGAILQLVRELAEYERLLPEVSATEAELRRQLFRARPAAEVLLAEVGEAVAGFSLFFHNFSTFVGRHGLYLEDIFVRPQFRGRGIGRGFFRRLARIALERNCGRLEWAVLNWNEPALGFYRKLGAVPMSDWIVQRLTPEGIARLAAG